MLRAWLLPLLMLLPLNAAGEDSRGDRRFPAIEAVEREYAEIATAKPAVLLAAAAAHVSERAPASRTAPAAGHAREWTLPALVAAARGVAVPEAPLSLSRQRRMLPWSTAPPVLA